MLVIKVQNLYILKYCGSPLKNDKQQNSYFEEFDLLQVYATMFSIVCRTSRSISLARHRHVYSHVYARKLHICWFSSMSLRYTFCRVCST